MPPFNMSFENQFYPCECCKPRYSTSTATNGRKYTLQEIVDEIVFYSSKVAHASWYNRTNYLERLKHWTEKLERYNEAKNNYQP